MHVDMLICNVLVFREAPGQLYLIHVRKNFHKTFHDRGRTYPSMVFLGHITYTAVVTSGANALVSLSDRFWGCSKTLFRMFGLCSVEFNDDVKSGF
jgi:hypothetical protein